MSVEGIGYFTEQSVCDTTITNAVFNNESVNLGTVQEVALFADNTSNAGTVSSAVFTEQAVNEPTGVVVEASFSGETSNAGTVSSAVFTEQAVNDITGVIVVNATFQDTSVSIGAISGSALFKDNSQLQGNVGGNVTLLSSVIVGPTVVIQGNAIIASTVTVASAAVFNGEVTIHYAPTFAPYPSASYVYVITDFNNTFYSNASGTNVENFTYTWYKDNNVILGATTSNLLLTATGSYQVILANEYGESLESSILHVSGVGDHTYITLQPEGSSLLAIEYLLSANSTGTGTVSTQWYANGEAVVGGNTNTLLVENISGNYTYVASTLYETATSNSVSVQLTAVNSFYSAKFPIGYNYVTKAATLDHSLSSNDFTIEAWVNPSINTGYTYIAGVGDDYHGWLLYTEHNGNLNFLCNGMGWSTATSLGYSTGQKLTPNKWQHVAVTRSNNNIRLFLDGVIVQEKAFTGIITTYYSAVHSGGNPNGGPSVGSLKVTDLRIIKDQALYTSNFIIPYAKLTETGYCFNSLYHNKTITFNQNITGTILELELQNSVFSSNWTKVGKPIITADTNWYLDNVALVNNFTGTGNGTQGITNVSYSSGVKAFYEGHTQGYYPHQNLWYTVSGSTYAETLQYGFSTLHTDVHSHNTPLSGDFIVSNTLYNVNNNGVVVSSSPVSATGIYSKAFNTSKSALVRLSDALNTGDFTFEAYVTLDILNNNQCIFDMPYSNDQLPYGGFVLQYYQNTFRTYAGDIVTTGGTISNLNEWYHVASVRQSGVLSLYVNGVRQSFAANTYSLTKQDLTIGKHATLNSTYAWNGKITNVRVSRIARYSGVYFDSTVFTPFVNDNDTLLLAFQTNSLEGYITPTGTVSSSPLSPWYLDKAAADTNFTGTGDGTTVGQYPFEYTSGTLIKHAYPQVVEYFVSDVYTQTTTWTDTLSVQENNTLYANKHDNTTVNTKYFTYNNTWYATNSSGVVSLSTAPWYIDRSTYGGSTYSINGNFNLVNEGNGVLVADHSSSGSLTVFNETAFDHGHNDFTMEYFTKISGWANSIDGADWSTGSHYPSPYFRFSYGPYNSRGVAVVVWDNEFASLPYSQDSIYGYTVQFNQWYHMAFTRQGNVFRLYVNGVKIGEKTWDITLDDEAISKTIFGGNDMYNQFAIGRMTAIRVVKGTALYTTDKFAVPTTVPTNISGTSLLLTFGATAVPDTTLTTDIFDESESRHLPAIGGGNWYGSNTITQSDEGNGVKTAVFNGASYIEYADTTTDFVMGSSSFTVELFVKPSNVSAGDHTYITTAVPNDFQGFYLGQNTAQSEVLLGNGSSPWSYIPDISAVTLTAGQWHHVALVKNNTNATLYVNGVNKGSMTYGSIGSNNSILSIGGRSNQGGQYFTGKMAGVRIVKGTAVYTSNFIPPTTLLTAISGTKLLLNFGATAVPAIG